MFCFPDVKMVVLYTPANHAGLSQLHEKVVIAQAET